MRNIQNERGQLRTQRHQPRPAPRRQGTRHAVIAAATREV